MRRVLGFSPDGDSLRQVFPQATHYSVSRKGCLFSVERSGPLDRESSAGDVGEMKQGCITWWALVDDLRTLPLGTFSEGRDSDFNSGVADAELFREHCQTGISRPQFQAPDQRRRQ